jgi:endonuclease YncB( thermonuclease family)
LAGIILVYQGLPKTSQPQVESPAVVQASVAPATAPTEASSNVSMAHLVTAQVKRVVDGDTIEVNINGQSHI